MVQVVLAIHFGEPPTADPDVVTDYLTEIFYQNAELEAASSEEEARNRARELARRRAPQLIEEYDAIGGSPMNAQAKAQVDALASRLGERGHDTRVELAYQFLDPSIESRIEAIHDDAVDRLVLLPIYPLCGPSTTVSALDRAETAIEEIPDWDPEVAAISGWHRHQRYLRLRVDAIRSFLDEQDVTLDGERTRLVFSAHGTPVHYVEAGSRYCTYVREFCSAIAGLLGDVPYDIGYQNHENRDIPWTAPAIELVVESMDCDEIVVDPVSFMHEQSETIGELDDELAELAAEVGLGFHRVPIPHDADAFPGVLADLVEPFLAEVHPAMYQLRPCQCSPGARCLNAPRT